MADKQKEGNGVSETAPAPPDAGDIASLWVDPGLSDPLTEEHTHYIPIGKPRDFFRTHPDRAYRGLAEIYVHKSENVIGEQFFLIGPAMRGRIDEARPSVIIVTVDRAGAPRLWPIMRPRDGEKDNPAWVTARTVAREAIDQWVKLVWKSRCYMSRLADPGYAPDPDFSKLPPFDDLVRIAFGSQGVIRDEVHPIYRDLFGKVSRAGADDAADLLA
jgi:hypothetical protein